MGKRIFCYGDSNTYGYDPRSYFGGRYPMGVRWTGLLQAAHPEWEVLNRGTNGLEIPRREGQLQSLEDMLRWAAPVERMVLLLGGNDLLQMPEPRAETAAERMEALLVRLLACPALEGRAPLLIGPPAMIRGAWVASDRLAEESRRLSAEYEALARRLGVPFADGSRWGVETVFDGVHFSEAGHRAFFHGLEPVLRKLLD